LRDADQLPTNIEKWVDFCERVAAPADRGNPAPAGAIKFFGHKGLPTFEKSQEQCQYVGYNDDGKPFKVV
jgi:hypothetical protein